MTTEVDLAATARLIGEPARATMLEMLMSGEAFAAGELARAAGVTAATASGHLSQLRAGGVVDVVHAGRHRYYRLASPDVAHALESLAAISPARPVRSLRQSRADVAMTFARTCYDHLAGRMGVALLDVLVTDGVLVAGGDGYEVTPRGQARLADFGLDVAEARANRRAFARSCLDFTERRPHLAGSLGAALFARMMALGWFVRRGPGQRGLRLTEAGREHLVGSFGIRLDLGTETPAGDLGTKVLLGRR